MTKVPDAEVLLIAALRAQPAISAAVSNRIATRLSGTYPAIRVTLLGGAGRPVENTALPELQVECWANGSDSAAESQASDLAREVEAAVPSLVGTYGPGQIVGAAVGGYVLHSPDAGSARERYLLAVTLVMQ